MYSVAEDEDKEDEDEEEDRLSGEPLTLGFVKTVVAVVVMVEAGFVAVEIDEKRLSLILMQGDDGDCIERKSPRTLFFSVHRADERLP
jgi:hypothetical protein